MVCITQRDIQAQETRKRIFRSAIDLFSRKGFAQTAISDIAEKADVSVGSFYEHFDCKEALLAEYMIALGSDYQAFYLRMQEGLEGKFSDHIEQIQLFLHTCLIILSHNSQYKDLLRVNFSYLIRCSSLLADHDRQFFHILSELIDHAKQEGSMRTDLSSNFILHEILFLYRSIAIEWCSSEENVPIQARFPELDELLRFLRKKEGSHRG